MEEEINYSTVVFKNGAPPSKEKEEEPTIYSAVKPTEPATVGPKKEEEPTIYSAVKPTEPATVGPKADGGGGAAAHSHFRVLAVFLGIFGVLLVVTISVIIYISVVMNKQKANFSHLTAEKDKLMTEKSDLEKQTEEMRRVTDNLNRTLGTILKFDTFPVNKYCQDKKCQPCQRDWLPFQDKCYLFYESKPWKSWGDSRQYCQNKAADLVVVDGLQEQEFINNNTKFYHDVYHGYWLGLYETGGKDWFWVDGRNDTLRYWVEGGIGAPGPRAMTFPDRSPTASWSTAKTTMLNKFICEQEALIWSN